MKLGEVDFTLAFRRLCDAAEGNVEPFRSMFIDLHSIDTWLARWKERAGREVTSPQDRVINMRATNPTIIPRNHRIEELIAAAVEDGDFEPFHDMLKAIAKPFEELPEFSVYMQPPMGHERVFRTFCGT
jgi:uncharacterized protein YdiU (UPF0061 family)